MASRHVVVPAVSAIAWPGSTSSLAAGGDRLLLAGLAADFASNPGSSALSAPRGRPAVHLVEQPRAGERVEVAPDRHVRDVEQLGQLADRTAPRRRTCSTISMLTLSGEHRAIPSTSPTNGSAPTRRIRLTFRLIRQRVYAVASGRSCSVFDPRRSSLQEKRIHVGSPDAARSRRHPLLTRRRLLSPAPSAGRAHRLRRAAARAPGRGGRSGGARRRPGTVAFGSNYSDAVPKGALQAALDAFSRSRRRRRRGQHRRPQHVPGADQQLPAGQPRRRLHLVRRLPDAVLRRTGPRHRISDVWAKIGPKFPRPSRQASTGHDGKQYFVPFYNYPWAVFYRKSVFEEKGYEPSRRTWTSSGRSASRCRGRLTPIASPTRTAGPRWARSTTSTCAQRLRLPHQPDGRQGVVGHPTGQGRLRDLARAAARTTSRGRAGPTGRRRRRAARQETRHVPARHVRRPAVPGQALEDLDFFPFPEINSEYGQDAVEAPIDGFMISKDPKNEDGAQGAAGVPSAARRRRTRTSRATRTTSPPTRRPTPAATTPLQKKAVELIGGAKHISQFLDRDTRPDFARR